MLGKDAKWLLRKGIEAKEKKIEQITQTVSSLAVFNAKKKSRRLMAIDNITRNFQEFADTLQEAE